MSSVAEFIPPSEDARNGARRQRRTAAYKEPTVSYQGNHTVAVVGAGLSGLATVAAIVHRVSKDPNPESIRLTIMWFDPKSPEEFGPGVAYQMHESAYDLNEPAKKMSILEDDPDHFVKWLKNSYDGSYGPEEFVPRSVYSEYLRACAAQLIKNAGLPNVTILTQCAQVHDISKNGHFRISTSADSCSWVPVDQAVLAVGHFPADDPFDKVLQGSGRYFKALNEEAHERAVQAIPKGVDSRDKNILIVGFGATAVDRIRLLDRAGYEGNITIINRHATRPWANIPALDGKTGYQLSFGINELMNLAKGCITNDNRDRTAAIEGFVDLLMQEIRKAQEQNFGPQNFLYSGELDDLLSSGQINDQFRDEAQKILTLFRANPTPTEDARLIERYERSGRLKIVVGEIVKPPVILDDGTSRIKVNLKPLGDEPQVSGDFDVVFGGSPYSRNYKNHMLLSALMNKGFGRISRETGVVERIVQSGFYAIGAATDRNWGVETFRRKAKKIADQVVKTIRPVASVTLNGKNVFAGANAG